MASFLRSRVPLRAAWCYVGFVLFPYVRQTFANDKFSHGIFPLRYATVPIRLALDHKTTNWLLAVGAGGALNSILLFALLRLVAYATASRQTK